MERREIWRWEQQNLCAYEREEPAVCGECQTAHYRLSAGCTHVCEEKMSSKRRVGIRLKKALTVLRSLALSSGFTGSAL